GGAQIGLEVAQRPAFADFAREAAIIFRVREQREPLRVLAQRLLVAVAIDAAKRAVRVDDSAVVGGRDHDRVVATVKDTVKAPLTIAQLIQHPPARRYAPPIGYKAGRALDVERGAAAPLHPPP